MYSPLLLLFFIRASLKTNITVEKIVSYLNATVQNKQLREI